MQGSNELKGIKHVKIYSREIVGDAASKIIVSSPNWDQKFSTLTPRTGKSGDAGNEGVQGPQGERNFS